MEDIELIEGLVFDHKTGGTGGPSKVEKAKVGLIQFCISPPKTDVSSFLASILTPLLCMLENSACFLVLC